MRWKRRKRNLEEARASYSFVHPETDLSLVELYDRAQPPQWERIESEDVDDKVLEFSDLHDVGDIGVHEDEDDQDAQGAVGWSDAYRVQQAVEEIRARHDALARPLLAQQARNPGVRLPALAALERQREQETSAILRRYQKADALERAARDQPYRRASAHERQQELAAAQALARDLPGRSRRHEQPQRPGRDTAGIAVW